MSGASNTSLKLPGIHKTPLTMNYSTGKRKLQGSFSYLPKSLKALICLSVIAVICLLSTHSAEAQYKRYKPRKYKSSRYKHSPSHEIFASVAYEVPLGAFGQLYKPAPGYKLGYSYNKELNDYFDLCYGAAIGYLRFKPKEEGVGDAEYGSYKADNFGLIELTFNLKLNFNPSEYFTAFLSADIGAGSSSYGYEITGPGINESVSIRESKLIFAPRLGLQYNISEYLGVSAQCRFNCLVTAGSTNPYGIDYNPNAGKTDFYLSNALGLHVRF